MKVPSIFTNQYILYLVVFLSVTNMIGYLVTGNLNALIYFLIIGIVTSIFSKNMTIILLAALVLSNIIMAGQMSSEGFTNQKEDSRDLKNDARKNVKNKKDDKKNEKDHKKKSEPTSSPSGKLPLTLVNDGPMETISSEANTTPLDNTATTSTSPNTEEAFEVGLENGSKKNYRVDYASTIEDAYGQLNQVLGSEGIKQLTDDTQNLLKQQLQLADAMKSMGPLISNMAPLIEQTKELMNGVGGFDMKNLGSYASLAKNFSPSANSIQNS